MTRYEFTSDPGQPTPRSERRPKVAKTMAERMGFVDGDLTTPGHDALMIWLDGYVETFLRERYALRDWTDEEITAARAKADAMVQEARENASDKARSFAREIQMQPLGDPPGPVRIIEKTWEKPLMDRKFAVSFVDLFVEATVMRGLTVARVHDMDSGLRYVVNDDYCGRPKWHGSDLWERVRFAFEVKTAIPSAGELIRQIRLQQEHAPIGSRFVVVSPDDRFRSVIEGQRIGFLKPPDEVLVR